MLFGKKKVKIDYDSYWERMLGYNYSKDFAIYNFLCRQKMKRKERNSIPEDKKFKTYSAWECYVRSLYQDKPLSELNEFIKYLNYRKRIDKTAGVLTCNLLIPLVIALLSILILPRFDNIIESDIKLDNSNLSIMLIEIGISIGVFWVQLFLIIGAIIGTIAILSKTVFSDNQVEAFYKDYMKIVEDIIADRKNSNGSVSE